MSPLNAVRRTGKSWREPQRRPCGSGSNPAKPHRQMRFIADDRGLLHFNGGAVVGAGYMACGPDNSLRCTQIVVPGRRKHGVRSLLSSLRSHCSTWVSRFRADSCAFQAFQRSFPNRTHRLLYSAPYRPIVQTSAQLAQLSQLQAAFPSTERQRRPRPQSRFGLGNSPTSLPSPFPPPR